MVVEFRYTKEEILKKYLETVYMGNGIYGISAALETYFTNENVTHIDEDAIVEIIVRLRYPNL
jgi:penicillin-binding protein 1A